MKKKEQLRSCSLEWVHGVPPSGEMDHPSGNRADPADMALNRIPGKDRI